MQDILTTAFNSVAIAGLLYITAAFAAHARYRFANPIAQEAPIPTAPKPVETASLAPTSFWGYHGTPAPAAQPISLADAVAKFDRENPSSHPIAGPLPCR